MSCAHSNHYGLVSQVILQSQVLDFLSEPDGRRVTESKLVLNVISISLECFAKMDRVISTLLTSVHIFLIVKEAQLVGSV